MAVMAFPVVQKPGGLDESPDAALRALFDAARDGDNRALTTLCATMRPRLFRVAWSVLKNDADADDVAQEALVKAVTRRFLFLGTGTVGGWMTTIALNLAKNRRRDRLRRADIVARAADSDLVARGARAADLAAPDAGVTGGDERARLKDAVAGLPERQREVVELRAVAGLEFKAVAETLGISEANARMSFSLAKKKLLALLVAREGEA
jgi:RNA polymerase sigma-70 factor (ECF subfamily)